MWMLLAVLVLLGLLAYVYACHSPRKNVSPEAFPWHHKINADNLDQVVDELMATMSLREKVAQLSGDEGPLVMIKLGINVMLLGRFPNIYAGNNKRLQIPPISFSDGPRGIVIDSATCFPVVMGRAASWDVALEARVGDAIAQEARAVGANYFGGLCINLLRHPAWGRAQECYGEDPYLMGEMAVALLEAVQKHHVMVCAKHFALNSIENSRFYVDVSADEKTLQEVYLPHFRRCVEAGVASLMSAYNQFRGEYCGHNPYLLQTVLREQWGFKGFVTSDWIWGVRDTVKPVKAGMDVEMPYGMYMGGKLLRAVKKGEVDEALIDRNVRRVIRTKLDFVRRKDSQRYEPSLLACERHRQLAQHAAEQSMVLLKNEGLLPLDKSHIRKLLLVGELANVANIGDHGSSRVSPPEVITFLQGLKEYAGGQFEVVYCDGQDTVKMDATADEADAIIVVAGYRHNDEGENLTSNRKPPETSEPVANRVAEGGDRVSLSLHQHDIALIHRLSRQRQNVAVVLVGGSAICTQEWDSTVASIVMAWYPGMMGGYALARILFGDVNPSGRLPFTVPAKPDDLPHFDPTAKFVDYGYFHGYTLMENRQIKPAYSFGFGLSYTSFELSSLSLQQGADDIVVSLTVSNTGDREGATVVQLYLGSDSIEAFLPHKVLRRFEKIMLQPGEKKQLQFYLKHRDFQVYDETTRQWLLEPGQYTLYLGQSSEDAEANRLSLVFGQEESGSNG